MKFNQGLDGKSKDKIDAKGGCSGFEILLAAYYYKHTHDGRNKQDRDIFKDFVEKFKKSNLTNVLGRVQIYQTILAGKPRAAVNASNIIHTINNKTNKNDKVFGIGYGKHTETLIKGQIQGEYFIFDSNKGFSRKLNEEQVQNYFSNKGGLTLINVEKIVKDKKLVLDDAVLRENTKKEKGEKQKNPAKYMPNKESLKNMVMDIKVNKDADVEATKNAAFVMIDKMSLDELNKIEIIRSGKIVSEPTAKDKAVEAIYQCVDLRKKAINKGMQAVMGGASVSGEGGESKVVANSTNPSVTEKNKSSSWFRRGVEK
ncbi:MAG: hypothetical protein KA998_02605 [Rickettsiaceae bacterium]|nr:hypothetical protein [Rickettsiaceae bacterium]